MVMATKPGTTVPVRIVRDGQERTINVTVDELDLDAETRAARTSERDDPAQTTSTGFGLTTAATSRRPTRGSCGSTQPGAR